MTAVAVAAPEAGTDIVALVEATPVIVLTDKAKFNQFYEAMREECDAHVPDLTTEKGRKAIASLAYKVARTKTAIDDAGKKLNEEARARINAVDESRREIRQQLDDLKDEVRRPLTEWEAAEEARVEQAKAELQLIRDLAQIGFDDTTETILARMDQLDAIEIVAAVHGDMAGIASAAKSDAIQALRAAHDRVEREEQERAELARLRAEAAERDRIEQEKREAEEAERKRLAAEEAEKERLAQIQREAEDRARREAEEAAEAQRQRVQREHEEALAAERRRAEEAERAAQAELARVAQEEAAREATAQREAAEQAAREADRAHRSKIMSAAKDAIMEAGPTNEAVAKCVVLAIAAGNIPNVSIRF